MIQQGGLVHPYGRFPGMSIRDYFAGQALQALIAAPGSLSAALGNEAGRHPTLYMTDVAYKFADSMLVSRKEES